MDRVNEFTFDIRLAIAKIFYFDTYETMVGNKSDHKFSDNSEESPRKFAGVEFKDCVPVKKFMAETFATVPSLKEACIRKITDFWDSIPDKDNVKFLPDELQEAILSSPQPN
ncbi:MAG: hypothetical protein HWD59_05205 [Coxiellaceae bacterium]|nr:MAG: hypothetical protein HWD59_05205 [Coxiellaceae bacterium]